MSLKFKRNYPIILLLVLALSFFTFVMGDQRIIAYTVKTESTQTGQVIPNRNDYSSATTLFDDSVVHTIQIIMSEDDYAEMIATYQQTGLKEYYKADILIDGIRVNEVGIRLKGNASLRTALGGGMSGGNQPAGGQPPNLPANDERPEPPAGFQPSENGQMPQPPGGESETQDIQPASAGTEQDTTEETRIPFLIKFDEYVDGQTYQGYSSIAIRTAGVSEDAAMLQEPVTNDTARLAGLPATQTAYTGFQVNESDPCLYVISEILDEKYLARYFENADGVLYKAEVGSTLSYVDENPSSYASSFSQETRVNDADLAPLIAFMRFLDQADEVTFENDLPKWLDVDSFAAYLALNNLLVNTDSIVGMNNNYYLYYDESSEQFTLLMWDGNESLGKLGGKSTYDLYFSNTGGQRGGGSIGGGQNTLVERFMANAAFKALYEEKVKEIYQQAFLRGAMVEDVERYSALIHSVNDASELVDIEAYNQAVQKVLTFISQRGEYLSSTELLGGETLAANR